MSALAKGCVRDKSGDNKGGACDCRVFHKTAATEYFLVIHQQLPFIK